MGNAALRSVPQDLTKCTTNQLQFMINSAIINNPWNAEEGSSDEEILQSTAEFMRSKGFRAITPQEYLELLCKSNNKGNSSATTIKLWVEVNPNLPSHDADTNNLGCSFSDSCSPMSTSSSISSSLKNTTDSSNNSKEEVFSKRLPSSLEEAVVELEQNPVSSVLLSQLETEEWPHTENHHTQQYGRSKRS